MPDKPILELKGVSKRYSGLEALSDVSFVVPQGAISQKQAHRQSQTHFEATLLIAKQRLSLLARRLQAP